MRTAERIMTFDPLLTRLGLYLLGVALNASPLWGNPKGAEAEGASGGTGVGGEDEGEGLVAEVQALSAWVWLAVVGIISSCCKYRQRWQLYPAFCSVCIAVLAHYCSPQALLRRAISACGLVLTCASAALDAVMPIVKLPTPRGPYKVGRVYRYWVDPTRASWATEIQRRVPDVPRVQPETGRRLPAYVWYPCTADPAVLKRHRKSAWVDPGIVKAICGAFHVPSFLMGHMPLVRTNSYDDAPPEPTAAGTHGCPVVLFAHSLGGLKMQNTSLMEELASYGYVVVACDFPYDSSLVVYEDGTQANFIFCDTPERITPTELKAYRDECVQIRAEDLRFVRAQLACAAPSDPLSELAIDPARCTLMGHSYGGGTVVHLAQQELSVQGCIMLDGWLWCNNREACARGLDTPLLSLRSPRFMDERDGYCSGNAALTDLLCCRTPGARSVVLDIGHYDYTDMIWISPLLFRWLGLQSVTSKDRMPLHRFLQDQCLMFLAEHNPAAANTSYCAPHQVASATLRAHWQDCTMLPTEGPYTEVGEWSPKQDEQIRSITEVVLRGEERWNILTFPHGGDLATEVQTLLCSHSLEAVRAKLHSLGVEPHPNQKEAAVSPLHVALPAVREHGKPTHVRTDSAHSIFNREILFGAISPVTVQTAKGLLRTSDSCSSIDVQMTSQVALQATCNTTAIVAPWAVVSASTGSTDGLRSRSPPSGLSQSSMGSGPGSEPDSD